MIRVSYALIEFKVRTMNADEWTPIRERAIQWPQAG